MLTDSDKARLLGNAAVALGVISAPATLALAVSMRGASRTAISNAFVVLLVLIGAFMTWRGIARSDPPARAVGVLALLAVIAFELFTVRNTYRLTGGYLRDADLLIMCFPVAASMALGAFAIREGQRQSQVSTVTKGWCGLVLGSVPGTFVVLAWYALTTMF